MLNKKKKADTGIVGTELKNELLKSACKNKLVHISTLHVYVFFPLILTVQYCL